MATSLACVTSYLYLWSSCQRDRFRRFASSGRRSHSPLIIASFLAREPSRNLTFCRNRIGNGFEMLRVNHRDGPSRCGVAGMKARVVLCEPFFESFSRGAHVVTIVT